MKRYYNPKQQMLRIQFSSGETQFIGYNQTIETSEEVIKVSKGIQVTQIDQVVEVSNDVDPVKKISRRKKKQTKNIE